MNRGTGRKARTNPRIVLWDSVCCIDYLNKDGSARSIASIHLYDEAIVGRIAIVCSALAMTETQFVANRDRETSDRMLDDFFQAVQPIALDPAVAVAARNLQLDHPGALEVRDAIHVATALVHRIEFLLTNDGAGVGGSPKNKKPMISQSGKLGGGSLQIVTPAWYVENQHPMDLLEFGHGTENG